MLDRLAMLISYGMGQKETPDLIARLTAPPNRLRPDHGDAIDDAIR